MRYTVRKSLLVAAYCYELDNSQLGNLLPEDGPPTREDVEQWLAIHASDFQAIVDFDASLEVGNETIDLPWADEDSELIYADCMYPSEDVG